MKCMIGLGNPGKKYNKTRHNVGFFVVDELIDRVKLDCNKTKFNCTDALDFVGSEKVLFVKPQTCMNISGEGVRPLLDFIEFTWKISSSSMMILIYRQGKCVFVKRLAMVVIMESVP